MLNKANKIRSDYSDRGTTVSSGCNNYEVGSGYLSGSIREAIASAVKFEVSRLSPLISKEVVSAMQQENCKLLGFFHEHAVQMDARQAELVDHQSIFMKAIVRHIEKLTESLSNLEDLLHSPRRVPTTTLKNDLSSVTLQRVHPEAPLSQHAIPLCCRDGEMNTVDDFLPFDLEGTKVMDQPVQSMADESKRYLKVTIASGANLKSPNKRKVTPCDPYCVCWIPNKVRSEHSEFESPVKRETHDPQWDYTSVLTDYSTGDSLNFKVLDQEMYAEDEALGEVSLDAAAIEQPGGFEGVLLLQPHQAGVRATLSVKVEVLQGSEPTREHASSPRESKTKKRSSNGASNTIEFVDNVLDKIEDDRTAEEFARGGLQKKHIMHLIKRLPFKLQQPANQFMQYVETFKEPERDSVLARVVDGKVLSTLSMLFVLIDQALTVSATNYSARNYIQVADSGLPAVYNGLETIITVWFALELVLKIGVHRLFFFVCGHWKLNCMDFFLVVYSFVEVVGVDLTFMRAFRVFKLAKVVRMLKALSQVRDLRVMVDCLISSGFAMFWAGVLIAFLTYIFALVFVQAMTDYMMRNRSTLTADQADMISEKFGSVELGILSLTMSLTGGFDWGEVYDLVALAGTLTRIACLFFVILFTISVWNIVSSIFVEKVMETAKPNAHEITEGAITQAAADAGELKEFFIEFDQDGTNSLDEAEFLKLSVHGNLSEFLALRDLRISDVDDATAFFQMAKHVFALSRPGMTPEGIQAIPFDSLVSTFLKVKGPASNLDLAVFKHQVQVQLDTIIKALGGLDLTPNVHFKC